MTSSLLLTLDSSILILLDLNAAFDTISDTIFTDSYSRVGILLVLYAGSLLGHIPSRQLKLFFLVFLQYLFNISN